MSGQAIDPPSAEVMASLRKIMPGAAWCTRCEAIHFDWGCPVALAERADSRLRAECGAEADYRRAP